MSVPPADNTTRGTAVFAGLLWTVALVAAVCLALGDQGAINGVLGAGVPAVLMTAAWWGLRRQDRRLAELRSRLRASR